MVVVPDLGFEERLWALGKSRVAGVDEAGLGSLAGPVVAAACLLPRNCQALQGVRDSKTLSAAQRERLFPVILQCSAAVGVGAASVREVDCLNVLRASHLAMRRALARIAPYDHVLLDGRPMRSLEIGPHTAIVDGDALSYAIACASIVAKVVRDRLMRRLSTLYPSFGWNHNAGYASQGHLAALREFGPTPLHRRSFAPVRDLLHLKTAEVQTRWLE